MKPAKFAYFRPGTVEDAVALLHDNGAQARVLAGGQSLIALMNRRLVRPHALVDITGLRDLRFVLLDDGTLRIGALAKHADLDRMRAPEILAAFGVLPRSARFVAHHPIRTRGTFGGSIAHADPTAEWCVLAVLLDAEIVAVGPAGRRVIGVGGFFTGRNRTALAADEIIVEVRFSRPAPHAALAEFSVRSGDYAVATAAAAVDLGTDGKVTDARIAVGGVADQPIRVPSAEKALLGEVMNAQLAKHAGRLVEEFLAAEAAESAKLAEADAYESARYRGELAATLTVRALDSAFEGADWKGQQG